MLVNIFESKEIMDAIKRSIESYARPDDVPVIMQRINKTNLQSTMFINQIHDILKRYFTTKRTLAILVELSRRLKALIDIDVKPRILEVSQGESLPLVVTVTNNSGLATKFRITVEQENKDTPVIYDPKRNFDDFKREIEVLMDSPQSKSFKIIIKPEMIGIKDLQKLNKEGHIDFNVIIKVESLDVVGLKNESKALVGIFK